MVALLSVYLTVFIDILGFGIIIPVLPYYATSLGANGFWIGALMTVYSAAQFFSAPILGRLSDRIGRRPVLLFSLIGSCISLLVTGLSTTLVWLLIGRCMAGMFGGSISTAQAYIADVTTREERSKYMGFLGASIGMAFVFGPAIGAGLSHWGFGTASLVASALALVNFIVAYVRLPESRRPGMTSNRPPRFSVQAFLSVWERKELLYILISSFALVLAFVFMESVFALLGKDYFSVTSTQLGLVFTYIGVLIVIVQGGLIGRLSKRYSDLRLAFVGSAILAVTLALMPYSSGFWMLMVVLGFMSLGQGLVSPTMSSMLSKAAHQDEQGGVLGLGQSAGAFARAIGPVTAGALYDHSRYTPFLTAGGVALLALILLIMLRSNRRQLVGE